MKRTHVTTLIALGIVGVAIGFLLETTLVAAGAPILVTPLALPLTLLAIGVIVVLLAIPIRRAVRGTVTTRIDPFRAMRIAVLAKACALAGALFGGWGVGMLVYVLTRTLPPSAGTVWLCVAAAVGGVALMVGGLIAEYFCTLPPPSDEDETATEHAPAR